LGQSFESVLTQDVDPLFIEQAKQACGDTLKNQTGLLQKIKEKINTDTPENVIISLLALQAQARTQAETSFQTAKADLEATPPDSPDYAVKQQAYEQATSSYMASHQEALKTYQ
jgi:hypothetical protein